MLNANKRVQPKSAAPAPSMPTANSGAINAHDQKWRALFCFTVKILLGRFCCAILGVTTTQQMTAGQNMKEGKSYVEACKSSFGERSPTPSFPPSIRGDGWDACFCQVVPFFQRVGIFRQMIDAERGEHQNGNSVFHHVRWSERKREMRWCSCRRALLRFLDVC